MTRAKPKIEARDAKRLALIADPSLLQQLANHLDGFPNTSERLAINHAVLGFDLDLVARPDAKDKSSAGQIVERRGRHGNRRRGAHEHAGNAGSQQDPRGLGGTSRQHRELVTAMTFRDPGRFIAEPFGELHAVDDLGRGRAAGKRDTNSRHANLQRML